MSTIQVDMGRASESSTEPEETSTEYIQMAGLTCDRDGKAREMKLFSIKRPHMRAFHYSWFGFFLAFTSWFAFQPLMPTIKKTIGITNEDIANANIASVALEIFMRVSVGVLCDKFGARHMFSLILGIGGVVIAISAYAVVDGTSLLLCRLFIGCIGSAFVACQVWTASMFSPVLVGQANAMAGGWGNMGGGFTWIIMPLIFDMFIAFGLADEAAWRCSILVPAAACVSMAILIRTTADSKPNPPKIQTSSTHDGQEATKGRGLAGNQDTVVLDDELPRQSLCTALKSVMSKRSVWILVMHYSCSFGVELSVNNAIGGYFFENFPKNGCTYDPVLDPDGESCATLTQTTAGLVASLFGLMNLFARPMGGILSDYLSRQWGMSGRLCLQMITLFLEGVMLMIFSQQTGLVGAIVCMVLFSTFTQQAEGSTFGIVPYVDKRNLGLVSGMVGAGGNIGAVVFGIIFKIYLDSDPSMGFFVIGVCCVASSFFTPLIHVDRSFMWTACTSDKAVQDPNVTDRPIVRELSKPHEVPLKGSLSLSDMVVTVKVPMTESEETKEVEPTITV